METEAKKISYQGKLYDEDPTALVRGCRKPTEPCQPHMLAEDWALRLHEKENAGVKDPIKTMSDEDFNNYVYFFTLKTARTLFDWTGCKPLLNSSKLIIGRVGDGDMVPSSIKYDKEQDCYILDDF